MTDGTYQESPAYKLAEALARAKHEVERPISGLRGWDNISPETQMLDVSIMLDVIADPDVIVAMREFLAPMTDGEPQTTHSANCWAWGPRHYECAMNEITRLNRLLSLYRDAVDCDVTMNGPVFKGVQRSAFKRAWDADRRDPT